MGFEEQVGDSPGNVPVIEGPGTKIGRYELLELLGEGGMGLVYLAEQQEPVRRKVALKIVKLGMDTMQVVARFEAERQTLALLEHSNVARVFDAGTTETGRPYFVMEYVEGVSITKYCDDQRLTVEQRLKLFRQACEAVHHAHQKVIIHRDIKPSNILVSMQDGNPVPKIIDFGIAKAITQPLTDKTSYTEHGQLLGTPEYMSPEQADMDYQQVDTRSDIYSLGVVLYELLAGVTPYDAEKLREGGIDHIQQIICEEEPGTPSARLTSLGDKARAIAESRRTQIFTLTRRLHRELEWIPMKAMRKDRTRRYRSASELADDIQNYLTGAPLIAGPESTFYRARKFVRKHAGSVAMVTLVFIAVLMGLAASILMGCRAEQARKQEAAARKQVEQALARVENAEKAAQEQAEEYRRLLYLHSISLADVAYQNNDITRLRRLLMSCPKDLRGWEWHRLNYVSDEAMMTLRSHSGDVWGVAVSPDGGRIASAHSPYERPAVIRVWDGASGEEIMTLQGHEAPILGIDYSPDGIYIVSGSHDKTVRVWDTRTGEEVMILRGHEGPVKPVAFSSDGKRIASGSADNTVRIWDVNSGKELMILRGHKGRVADIAFAPDGDTIISAGWDETARVWDLTNGNELMTLRGHHKDVTCVAISPDGERIVSGSQDRTLRLWDASSGDELMTLRGHTRGLWTVAFSVDGSTIASAGRDDVIRIWDTETGTELRTLYGHEGSVFCVAFCEEGKRVVSGSNDETVKVWGLAVDHEFDRIGTDDIVWQGVSFSPDGNRVLSGSRKPGGLIRVWDRWTGEELMTLRGSEGDTVARAEFSPDGSRILMSQIGKCVIWNANTGKKLMDLYTDKGYVLAAFSPDGRYLASWTADWSGEEHDYTVKLRNAETGEELMTLDGHEAEVQDIEFSPDGKVLVSGDIDGTINEWDVKTGEKLLSWEHTGGILAVAFSPDGSCLATTGTAVDTTVKVWDTATGAKVMTLQGHDASIWSVAFSPNGKRIVSASRDRTVKIWDMASKAELLTIREPSAKDGWTIPIVRFSPDGKTIAVGGFGGIMLLESEKTDNTEEG
jgi:WD40 repeat protein/predicted Ser/Thr protein kinase